MSNRMWPVVFLGTGTAAVLGVTGWMGWGAETDREAAGVLLGFAFAQVLVHQIGVRLTGQEKPREVAPVTEVAEDDRDTGRWVDSGGDAIVVRWDPAGRRYWVHSVVNGGGLGEAVPWMDWYRLREFLVGLEEGGAFVPQAGLATRAIRARLDMPGWEVDA